MLVMFSFLVFADEAAAFIGKCFKGSITIALSVFETWCTSEPKVEPGVPVTLRFGIFCPILELGLFGGDREPELVGEHQVIGVGLPIFGEGGGA